MEMQIIYAFWARDFLSLHYLFTLQSFFLSFLPRLLLEGALAAAGSCPRGDGRAANARCVGEARAAGGDGQLGKSFVGLALPVLGNSELRTKHF